MAKPCWSYAGDTGPSHWASLAPSYQPCREGQAQSPIDITTYQKHTASISLHYGVTALRLFDNGFTIQIDCDTGAYVCYEGRRYNLQQFHFHHPAEHTIDNQRAAMELHFVHTDADGQLLVVGVLLEVGEQSPPAYGQIFAEIPTVTDTPPPQPTAMLHLNELLPPSPRFFSYRGSLTTPPCSEGVQWFLCDEPVTITQEQIDIFTARYPYNARPIQPLNAREVHLITPR